MRRVPTLLSLCVAAGWILLASCTSGDRDPSAGTLSTPVELELDEFVPEHPEAVVLGALDHVVTGSVRDIAQIPDSFGRSGMTFVVDRVDWHADWRWFFGEKQDIKPLQFGDEIYVAVDDGWALQKGDDATVALAMIPFDDLDGFARVVLGTEALSAPPDPSLDHARDLSAPAMQRYLAAAAQVQSVSLHPAKDRDTQTTLLVQLIADARAWLDAENRAPSRTPPPEPGGLIAEANAVIAGGAPPSAAPSPLTPRADDLAAVPPDLRQLPIVAADVTELSAALGVELKGIQGAVFDATATYTYFALRFPGVGVLGPWNTDPELHFGNLLEFAPVSGSAELLAWTQAAPQPNSAVMVGRFDLPKNWDAAAHSLVVTVTGGEKLEVQLVEHVELTKRIEVLLTTRVGP